jgi:hypothetical protein
MMGRYVLGIYTLLSLTERLGYRVDLFEAGAAEDRKNALAANSLADP